MDASTYHDLWVNIATNSPFLAWMIYSYVQTQKDLKETREHGRQESKEIRAEARQEEQEIRARFESVIADLNKDRTKLVEGFSGRIDSLERGQRKLFALLEPIKEQIHEIKLKEKIKKELSPKQRA
jgi:translation initiation factor IF-3